MKKGFTLIEILAVVTIIGLIFILVIPKIATSLKNKKGDVDTTTNNIVLAAAKSYVADNHDKFDKTDNNTYCLPISTLTKKEYLESPVKNVTDDVDITNTKSVKITYNKGFKYEIVDKKECEVVSIPPCEYDYCDLTGNGYTEVDYLESTGTQYIDTGFKPNQDTKVEMIFDTIQNNTEFYFGARNSNQSNTYSFLQFEEKFRSDYAQANGDEALSPTLTTISTFPKFKVVKDKNLTVINDNITLSLEYNNFQSDYNMYIFAVNQQNQPLKFSRLRLYSFKIYDNNLLVRDYLPVVDQHNELCLFDSVNKKCYYNKGTEKFITNQKFLCENENEYTKINYIESSGAQYIDTNFKPNQDTRVEMVFDVLQNQTEFYFGARETNSSNTYSFLQYLNKFRGDFAQTNGDNVLSPTIKNINTFPKFKVLKDKNVTIINDSITLELEYSNFQSNYNMYIFAINKGGSSSGFSKIRLYSFKIYDNNSLIRKYAPMIDQNNKLCLFDTVQCKCYYNQGTGEFLYG